MFPPFQFQNSSSFHSIAQFFHLCSQTKNLKLLQKFHAHLLRTGLLFISPNLQTKLIFTSTSLHENNLKTLTNFFKLLSTQNPLPFNSLISQFCQNGFDSFALHTLSFMHHRSVCIDSYALCSSLNSSSCLKDVYFGRMIHVNVEKSGWLGSVFVGSALIDFYSKLLHLGDAAKVFDEMPVRNTVCANALLSGYAEAKMWGHGIELVRRIPKLGLSVDNFTLSATLRSSTGLYDVESGKQIHGIIIRKLNEFGNDVFLQSLLIEMYGKCGLVGNAKKAFDMSKRRDVILWTSMLGVFGKNGNHIEVIKLFQEMINEGVKPDGVAFLTVISACSHTGKVDLGTYFFDSMIRDYNLAPTQEHYSCLVDLLCRAGELSRAWNLVSDVSFNENSTVSFWGAFLCACNECGNVKLGKLAAQRALDLDPENVGIYVLLSNLYAKSGMWDEIEQLREVMKRRGLKKDIGWSLI